MTFADPHTERLSVRLRAGTRLDHDAAQGSGFLDASGKAFGVLSTVAIAPLPASNGVGDLARELAYAQSHGFGGLSLVPGTEPFSSPI